ncbi:MAG: hypothetical protein H6765_08840 [Candidatus Peribacteria bacterium]|nr:MAG: hypothetical protein H6765_08840 [Candidatus Peribacteria bacterium]
MPAQEYGSEFDIKEISIPVSGPELIYTHLYIYHDGDQMPDRYFVPALKFQVHWDQVDKETTKDTYFRPGQPEMIVPLIEDAYLQ